MIGHCIRPRWRRDSVLNGTLADFASRQVDSGPKFRCWARHDWLDFYCVDQDRKYFHALQPEVGLQHVVGVKHVVGPRASSIGCHGLLLRWC
jgi:hypothetical protein